jgi:hypothetical protein
MSFLSLEAPVGGYFEELGEGLSHAVNPSPNFNSAFGLLSHGK